MSVVLRLRIPRLRGWGPDFKVLESRGLTQTHSRIHYDSSKDIQQECLFEVKGTLQANSPLPFSNLFSTTYLVLYICF